MSSLEDVGMVVNPFKSGRPDEYTPVSQTITDPESLTDRAVEDMLSVYKNLDRKMNWYLDSQILEGLEFAVLKPSQIEILMQKIILETDRWDIIQDMTGLFFSRLIKDSYNKGYNDFVLGTQDYAIHYLGDHLVGSAERMLNLRIEGDMGMWCGKYIRYTCLTIHGCVGALFGHGAYNCDLLTSDIDTFGKIESSGGLIDRNRVILTDAEGNIIKEVKK